MRNPPSVDLSRAPRHLWSGAFFVLMLWASGAHGQTVVREDFGTLEVGHGVSDWSWKGAGRLFRAVVAEDCDWGHDRCLKVFQERVEPATTRDDRWGTLVRTVDVQRLVGKRVRLRARARVQPPADVRARLWLRTEGTVGWPNDSGKTTADVTSLNWADLELVRDVDENDRLLTFGVDLANPSKGSVWIDDVEVDVLPPPVMAATSARDVDRDRVESLRQHAVRITSINPSEEDFTDLEPLRRSIGDARVVMLGEPSHGDGATFLAKQRLIRFLHQQMGFDVLAWESGFFTVDEMERALRGGAEPQASLRKGLPSVWGYSPLLVPLARYAQDSWRSDRPLRMIGVDPSYVAEARRNFTTRLFALLDSLDTTLMPAADRQSIEGLMRDLDLDNLRGYSPGPGQRDVVRAVITNLIKRLEALPASAATLRDVVFFRKTLEDLLHYEQLRTVGLNRSGVMGENLAWVMREWYPGRKVIVWAHQSHVSRDGYVQLRGDSNQEMVRLQRLDLGTLREAAERRLGSVIYGMAFTAHHGRWATLHSPPTSFVAPPEATETLLHATGWPYLFIDFRRLPRDSWSGDPQVGLKLYSPQPLDWSRHFDGLMFTDEMFPSRPDGHVPSWATETLRR